MRSLLANAAMRLTVFILSAFIGLAPCFGGSILLLGAGSGGGGGGCSQATTFLARTSGLSGTETTAYTTMICGMVTDGTWAKLDALYIFATNTTTTANLNLVSTSFGLTAVGGATTFTADSGYAFNGHGFDTGLVLTSATQYTLNNAAMGCYILNNRTTSQAGYEMGVTSTNASEFRVLNSSLAEFDLNEQGFPTAATTTSQGSWFLNRTPGPALNFYRNGNTGSPIGTSSTAVGAIQGTFSVYIGGRNAAGTFTGAVTDTQSAVWIGGGFSSADVASFSARINAYMTALGINVY